MRGLRVTDYNGVSLSTVARSEMFIEPSSADIADRVAALRAAYDPTAETTAAGAGLATARGPGGSGAGPAQRTTLVDMQPELLPPATAPFLQTTEYPFSVPLLVVLCIVLVRT